MNELIIQEDNRNNSIKLRKYSNRLVMSGIGIMVLGFWESLRAVMGVIFFRSLVFQYLSETAPFNDALSRYVYITFFVAIMSIFGTFSLLIHLYVGRCAVLDGRGKKKKRLYLFFALIFMLMSFGSQFLTDVSDTKEKSQIETDIDLAFATDLLDITLCLTCAEMLYCAARMRLLQRALRKEQQAKEAQ